MAGPAVARDLMFLFTTPAETPKTSADQPVAAAIRDAAQRTGTPFDYLLKTAQRESNLDPKAKASTSSATGLFQFLEQTWLGVLKAEGGKHGLAREAEAITPTGSGRYTVADPDLRSQILALREDPGVASKLAGVFTQKNRETLSGALGREPSQGELYMAHFLGAGGAVDLVRMARDQPGTSAISRFPEAAAANRSVFYSRDGKPRSAGDVYDALAAQHQAQPASSGKLAEAAQQLPGHLASRPLLGLFRSDGGSGAAQALGRTWLSLPGRKQAAAASDATAFFPRSGEASAKAASAAPQAPAEKAATPRAVEDIPLPPQRPQKTASARASRKPVGAPLDLNAFARFRG